MKYENLVPSFHKAKREERTWTRRVMEEISRVEHFTILKWFPSQEPEITHKYSHPKTAKNLPKDLTLFCFPELDSANKFSLSLRSFTIDALLANANAFVVVFTGSDGRKLYGFVRRHAVHNQKTEKAGLEAICILSYIPAFSLFEPLLEIIQVRWLIFRDSVFSLVHDLVNQELPSPGEPLTVLESSDQSIILCRSLFEFIGVSKSKASKNKPFSVAFSRPRLEPLFSTLSAQNVLFILSSLLQEKKIVFTSSDISLLSDCIHASLSLLYPFSWSHIFMPILPLSMSHLTSAPVPFLVGVLASDIKSMLASPVEQCLLVNLDTDSLQLLNSRTELKSTGFPQGLSNKMIRRLESLVPMAGSKLLKKGLEAIARLKNKSDYPHGIWIFDQDSVEDSFIAFMVALFGHWYQCIDINQADYFDSRIDLERFMRNSVVDSQDVFSFFQSFCQTQLFSNFSSDYVPIAASKYLKKRVSLDNGEDVIRYRFYKICELMINDDELKASNLGAISDRVKAMRDWIFGENSYQKKMNIGKAEVTSIIMDLTSNNPTIPFSEKLLQRIIRSTYINEFFEKILPVIWFRISDCDGRNWKHGQQALRYLKVMLDVGSERVFSQSLAQQSRISALSRYKHTEEFAENQIVTSANSVMSFLKNSDEYSQSRKKSYKISYEMEDAEGFRYVAPKIKQSSNHDVEESPLIKALLSQFAKLEKSVRNFEINDECLQEAYQKYEKFRHKSIVLREGPLFPPFLPMHNSFKYKEQVPNVKPQKVKDILDFGIIDAVNVAQESKTPANASGRQSKPETNRKATQSKEPDLLDLKLISSPNPVRLRSSSTLQVSSSTNLADDILNFAFESSTKPQTPKKNPSIAQDFLFPRR